MVKQSCFVGDKTEKQLGIAVRGDKQTKELPLTAHVYLDSGKFGPHS